MLAGIMDKIMDFLYALAEVALMLLPESPLQTESVEQGLSSFSKIMANINYFIPFGWMLTIGAAYITCVLIWYAARWVLRITKYIA